MPTRYRKRYPLRFQVQVFAKSEGRCFYCGGGADVMDHVVPESRGGRDAFDNLVPACWRCNCGKGGHSVEQYRNTRARADPDIPNFAEKQLRWLARQGISLPLIPVYRFWFEEQGLRFGNPCTPIPSRRPARDSRLSAPDTGALQETDHG